MRRDVNLKANRNVGEEPMELNETKLSVRQQAKNFKMSSVCPAASFSLEVPKFNFLHQFLSMGRVLLE